MKMTIEASRDEIKAWRADAKACNMPINEYVRQLLNNVPKMRNVVEQMKAESSVLSHNTEIA